jgi:hypothetical protein
VTGPTWNVDGGYVILSCAPPIFQGCAPATTTSSPPPPTPGVSPPAPPEPPSRAARGFARPSPTRSPAEDGERDDRRRRGEQLGHQAFPPDPHQLWFRVRVWRGAWQGLLVVTSERLGGQSLQVAAEDLGELARGSGQVIEFEEVVGDPEAEEHPGHQAGP